MQIIQRQFGRVGVKNNACGSEWPPTISKGFQQSPVGSLQAKLGVPEGSKWPIGQALPTPGLVCGNHSSTPLFSFTLPNTVHSFLPLPIQGVGGEENGSSPRKKVAFGILFQEARGVGPVHHIFALWHCQFGVQDVTKHFLTIHFILLLGTYGSFSNIEYSIFGDTWKTIGRVNSDKSFVLQQFATQ